MLNWALSLPDLAESPQQDEAIEMAMAADSPHFPCKICLLHFQTWPLGSAQKSLRELSTCSNLLLGNKFTRREPGLTLRVTRSTGMQEIRFIPQPIGRSLVCAILLQLSGTLEKSHSGTGCEQVCCLMEIFEAGSS